MYIVMDEEAWQAYVDKSLEDKLIASKDDLTKWADIQNDGKPIMCSGTDLAELAGKMGVNAGELAATIKNITRTVHPAPMNLARRPRWL